MNPNAAVPWMHPGSYLDDFAAATDKAEEWHPFAQFAQLEMWGCSERSDQRWFDQDHPTPPHERANMHMPSASRPLLRNALDLLLQPVRFEGARTEDAAQPDSIYLPPNAIDSRTINQEHPTLLRSQQSSTEQYSAITQDLDRDEEIEDFLDQPPPQLHLSREERKRWLESDPLLAPMGLDKRCVTCTTCEATIKLKYEYDVQTWEVHKERCTQGSIGSRTTKEEREEYLKKDPLVKTYGGDHVECSMCNVRIKFAYPYGPLRQWISHRLSCWRRLIYSISKRTAERSHLVRQ